MALLSVGANNSLTKSEIHDLEMESMRSLALMSNFFYSSKSWLRNEITISGTQGSNHTYMDLPSPIRPSPIRKHAPFATSFLASLIALHVREVAATGSAVNHPLFTLYLDLNTSMHKLCLSEATNHANLAIKAKFISFVFLKPSPPYFLEQHSLSHVVQAMYLLPLSLGFHQNRLVAAFSLLQVLVGTLNVDRVYVGIL